MLHLADMTKKDVAVKIQWISKVINNLLIIALAYTFLENPIGFH